jgi:hypothetical protein
VSPVRSRNRELSPGPSLEHSDAARGERVPKKCSRMGDAPSLSSGSDAHGLGLRAPRFSRKRHVPARELSALAIDGHDPFPCAPRVSPYHPEASNASSAGKRHQDRGSAASPGRPEALRWGWPLTPRARASGPRTTVYTVVVDGVMVRALPYEEPGALGCATIRTRTRGPAGCSRTWPPRVGPNQRPPATYQEPSDSGRDRSESRWRWWTTERLPPVHRPGMGRGRVSERTLIVPPSCSRCSRAADTRCGSGILVPRSYNLDRRVVMVHLRRLAAPLRQ